MAHLDTLLHLAIVTREMCLLVSTCSVKLKMNSLKQGQKGYLLLGQLYDLPLALLYFTLHKRPGNALAHMINGNTFAGVRDRVPGVL